MEVKDNTETSKLPLFERAIIGAEKRLNFIERQLKLQNKTERIFHTFNRAFEDIKKAIPEDCQIEAHSDRVCFEIHGVPISIIYVPQLQPTYLSVNKQKVLAERIYICDKYFGKNSYEMVGPSEREVGSIFLTEETYLVRWIMDGKSFFFPTVYELVDATLSTFFSLCEMFRDKYSNVMEVNLEDYHYKVTPLDLLTSTAGDLESGEDKNTNHNSSLFGSQAGTRAPVKKNVTIYGKNVKF